MEQLHIDSELTMTLRPEDYEPSPDLVYDNAVDSDSETEDDDDEAVEEEVCVNVNHIQSLDVPLW